jgi:hypothetical protein
VSLTRDRELLKFVNSALGHITRAQLDAFQDTRNRSMEQAINRLNDLKVRLQADTGDAAEAFNSGRAVGEARA